MLFEHTNYRSFLKAELEERIQRNPSYSLRAMASQLGFSGSTLSEVMNGKANFSVESARKLSKKLGLSGDETEYLCLLVQVDSIKDLELKASMQERLASIHPQKREVKDLQVDQFKQIADWYHSVILELVYLEGFKFTPANIAKKVGITKLQAEVAVERLERLGLIERNAEGKYARASQDYQVRSPEKNAALRSFYTQILEKVRTALEEQTPRERLSGFETIPLDPSALPEINEAAERFFGEVVRIARKYPKKTEVYHLAVHFLNLTKKEEKEV